MSSLPQNRASVSPHEQEKVPLMSVNNESITRRSPASDPSERIFFNIAGTHFEVSVRLLAECSVPVLNQLARDHRQSPKAEYFFDRNPRVFEAVLDLVHTGELHAPRSMCGRLFLRELLKWDLDAENLSPCCIPYTAQALTTYNDSIRIEKWYQPAKSLDEINRLPDGWNKTKWKAWFVLDHPHCSRPGTVYGLVSFALVMVSVTSMYLQTLPVFKRDYNHHNPLLGNTLSLRLFVLDMIVACIFTLEIGVRLFFCPCRKRYVKDVLNWIDILAVIPFYVEVGVVASLNEEQLSTFMSGQFYVLLSLLRVLRVLRIYHLFRWFTPMKLIALTFKASTGALLMLLCLLSCLVITFAALYYYAELNNERGGISDMFLGLYWAIITLTTVGYGDIAPLTLIGKIITSIASVLGLLTFAIALAPLSSNFSSFFDYFSAENSFRNRQKENKKERNGNC